MACDVNIPFPPVRGWSGWPFRFHFDLRALVVLRPDGLPTSSSSRCAACSQAGAFGPIFWSPIYPFKVKDDDAGEDTTGSKTTGRYNSWRLELYITGGGTALEKPGNLFPGFIEGDNVGKVATGRLSMILDIVRSVTRTLAMRLATHLGVTPGETHSSELGSCLA